MPSPRPAYRLIPSQFPPIGLFDAVATAADLAAVMDLVGWTNDRLVADRITRLLGRTLPCLSCHCARQDRQSAGPDRRDRRLARGQTTGRLWDCLLGFLDPETNARYPDPALQTNLDLSHVSYVATANGLDPLPSSIRDRFRVAWFRKPSADDLDALLPAVIADLAQECGLDQSWVPPLDGLERRAVAQHWRGGSARLAHDRRQSVWALLEKACQETIKANYDDHL